MAEEIPEHIRALQTLIMDGCSKAVVIAHATLVDPNTDLSIGDLKNIMFVFREAFFMTGAAFQEMSMGDIDKMAAAAADVEEEVFLDSEDFDSDDLNPF